MVERYRGINRARIVKGDEIPLRKKKDVQEIMIEDMLR
jgi:hypothetical protein